MSIVTKGWGSPAIATGGFGSSWSVVVVYIPSILAEYTNDVYVYSCVDVRQRNDILNDRDIDNYPIIRSDYTISNYRDRDGVLQRLYLIINNRESTGVVNRDGGLDRIGLTQRGDALLSSIRSVSIVSDRGIGVDNIEERAKDTANYRSGGWPWQSPPCIE